MSHPIPFFRGGKKAIGHWTSSWKEIAWICIWGICIFLNLHIITTTGWDHPHSPSHWIHRIFILASHYLMGKEVRRKRSWHRLCLWVKHGVNRMILVPTECTINSSDTTAGTPVSSTPDNGLSADPAIGNYRLIYRWVAVSPTPLCSEGQISWVVFSDDRSAETETLVWH